MLLGIVLMAAAVSVFAYQCRRMSGAFAVYLPRHQNGCQRIALLLQFLFLLLLKQGEIIPLAARLKFEYWGYYGIGNPQGGGGFEERVVEEP
ncbi:unnamed protein product [Linum trigynum]|uniref:Secreted protein n=1 Tax=Linum trigynum TaxID=586398 RepID=A0AAV2FC11_9ROSI